MAAYLQRGFSNVTSNRYDSLVDGNSRQKPNMNSPLQIFVKAKKNINDIFAEISDYVAESTNFIEGMLVISHHNLTLTLSILQDSLSHNLMLSIRLKMKHFAASY